MSRRRGEENIRELARASQKRRERKLSWWSRHEQNATISPSFRSFSGLLRVSVLLFPAGPMKRGLPLHGVFDLKAEAHCGEMWLRLCSANSDNHVTGHTSWFAVLLRTSEPSSVSDYSFALCAAL